MEFEGKIVRVLQTRCGTSQRGEWKALPFVFEYKEPGQDRVTDRVLLETFDTNVMAAIGQHLMKGVDNKAIIENGEMKLISEVRAKCGFGHRVKDVPRRDGSGNATINEIRPYLVEILDGQQQIQQPAQPPQPQMPFTPQSQSGGGYDDLPF